MMRRGVPTRRGSYPSRTERSRTTAATRRPRRETPVQAGVRIMQAKRTSISWRLWALGLAAPLGAALGGAAVAPAAAQSGPAEAESAHRPGGPWEDLLRHWSVERHLRGMSLEERVGQLFVTYAHGETADTAEPEDVAANR